MPKTTYPSSWVLDPSKLMTQEEVATLLAKAKLLMTTTPRMKHNDHYIKNYYILLVAFNSGLRVQEICDLRIRNLTQKKGLGYWLTVECGKCRKKRVIKIPDRVGLELNTFIVGYKLSHGEPCLGADYLFLSSRGVKYHKNTIQKMFKSYCKLAGIPTHYSIHCARHTYATNLYEKSGCNLRAVQKQLGHSSLTTTQVYADVYDPAMATAVEKSVV